MTLTRKFYIRNRGPVGNCLQWWREGGHGYTCNLNEAGIFDADQAMSICRDRPEIDEAWPVEQIDALAERHVDFQKLPKARNPRAATRRFEMMVHDGKTPERPRP